MLVANPEDAAVLCAGTISMLGKRSPAERVLSCLQISLARSADGALANVQSFL